MPDTHGTASEGIADHVAIRWVRLAIDAGLHALDVQVEAKSWLRDEPCVRKRRERDTAALGKRRDVPGSSSVHTRPQAA